MKLSVFLAELDHHKKTAQFLLQKVPHVLPHSEVISSVVSLVYLIFFRIKAIHYFQ